MAIAIDASSPAVVTATASTATTLPTASFTPPAGSLLVVLAGLLYAGSTGTTTCSVSNSTGLTWTTSAAELAGSTSGHPNVAVFTALTPTSTAMTVTLTSDASSKGKQLQVMVLTGTAASSWTGGTAISITTMDPSLTTTTSGAMVLGSCIYDSGTTTLTADAHSTIITSTADTGDGGRLVSFRSLSLVVTPGATTYGVTGATTICSYAAAEILPANAATVAEQIPLLSTVARNRAANW